jgi:hypothetical protein
MFFSKASFQDFQGFLKVGRFLLMRQSSNREARQDFKGLLRVLRGLCGSKVLSDITLREPYQNFNVTFMPRQITRLDKHLSPRPSQMGRGLVA